MLGKTFNFLVSVAINGFVAIFVAAFFYLILAIVFAFTMIPVSIIAGESSASKVINFLDSDGLGYKIIYAIVFISMVMDDLGIPSVKKVFGRWREKKKR